jgi:hypothetical protein
MSRTSKARIAVATLAAVALAAPGAAGAVEGTKVTIKDPNDSGDFFGYVKSDDLALCAAGRKVTVYRMTGASPDPRSDEKIASDTASLVGSRARWEVGNTGQRKGKFYARVKKTPGCKGAISKVI